MGEQVIHRELRRRVRTNQTGEVPVEPAMYCMYMIENTHTLGIVLHTYYDMCISDIGFYLLGDFLRLQFLELVGEGEGEGRLLLESLR